MMEPKVYTIKEEESTIPSNIDTRDEIIRNRVREAAQDFKASWRNLAASLYTVWKDKLYLNWGYKDFDQYTAKEVSIRRHTALKLIQSYAFLKKEEPVYLSDEPDDSVSKKDVPSFEVVSTLQRAKRSLDDQNYNRVKADLLTEGRDLKSVKKDLTQMIRQRKSEVDPEAARTRTARVTVKRFISDLERFKREIKILSILPHSVADDIDKLIKTIEESSSF